jgi:prepilin-type processing-associated H-X9-DG protein
MNKPSRGISWATLLVGVLIGAVGMYVLGAIVERVRYGDTTTIRMTKDRQEKARAQADKIRSQSNMRGIVQGLIMYSNNHREQFPQMNEWESLLIQGDYIIPEMLISPISGEGAYTLVTMPTDLDATLLVLYEDPNNYDSGVNVAYADTHVEHLPHDEFDDILDGLDQDQSH